jgi:protein SCO1/2
MLKSNVYKLVFNWSFAVQHLLKTISLVLLLVFLSACKPTGGANKLVATDITGADFGKSFSLTDHTGKPRTLTDFKGKVVTLFFGYTHCPDVCPTTMVDLKQTMKLLGSRADEVQVLFVTLDPARDTQELLAQFVPSFDKRFIGLRGTEQETAATAEIFKVYAKKVEAQGKGGYTIDHSAGLYVFDKIGKIRLYVDYGEKPAEIANDIKQIL